MTGTPSAAVTEALAQHGFFSGLAPEDLARIAACGEKQTLPAGTLLAREGETAATFYALLQGCIAIETHLPNRDPMTLQTLEQGAVIGWSWLEDFEWVFTVRALTDCSVVALDASRLRPLLLQHSALGLELMQRLLRVMTQRLKATRLQLMDVYGQRSDE